MRVLVADDEPLARERIVRFLADHPAVTETLEAPDGPTAVQVIREQRPDIVFLDVQMPGVDGFTVLRQVRDDPPPAVVFVTAYDAYALGAFEVHAVDYLLKPYDAERFLAAFQRASEKVAMRSVMAEGRRLASLLDAVQKGDAATAIATGGPGPVASNGAAIGRHLERIMVKADGRTIFVRAADVDWLESSGNYVKLHVGRNIHVIRETIKTLEARLDPAMFVRIHRRLIVNLDRIRELQPWFGGDQVVILKDGARLRLSRTFREKMAEKMYATA
jgi:two-component system LytT family response regulator